MPPRRPLRSPIQNVGQKPDLLLQIAQALPKIVQLHKEIMQAKDEIVSKINAIKQGERGPQGYAGIGRNGRDGKDAPPIDEEALLARILAKIPTPRDGRPGKNAEPVDTTSLLEELKKRKVKVEDIEDLNPALDSMIKRYGAYIHGGGDTVAAGSNITITTNTSTGSKVISSTASVTAWSTPPETVNAVNTVFTVTAEPTDVIADGVQLFSGQGYTYAALQITFDNPPSTYVRYR